MNPETPETPEFFRQKPAKQTPIPPSNLKPLIPEDTDLNAMTDKIWKEKIISDAESAEKIKRWAEEQVAIRIKNQREDDAAAREAERLRLWHEKNAADRAAEAASKAANRAAEAASKAAEAADKAKRQHDARQKELKGNLTAFIAACVQVASDLEEIEDKNCVQVRLLRESINALIESFPKS